MALTTDEITLYTARLAAARTALHSLFIGTSARVVVDQNGERVEYTATNVTRLQAYIKYLENLLAGGSQSAGPMKVWFK